jgi:hypothetical protein
MLMATDLKLRFEQTHVPAERLRERLRLARLYILLTRTFHEMAFPHTAKSYGSNIEALLVLVCVFIGDAEGRPTTVTKIASHAGLPRATVYRRLEQLCAIKKITRVGRSYYLASGAAHPDDHGRLSKILEGFLRN